MKPALRRLTGEDAPRLRRFWEEHWGGAEMIVHGEIFRPEELEGFIANDWAGVVTYTIRGDECEIISLNSLHEHQGIGTTLIAAVVDEACRQNCGRVSLTTTNDNLKALGFYQRQGFELVLVRRGAVEAARKLKPGIPLIGENAIPLRDEIELEKPLRRRA